MKLGTLYGIGVGPGDPELITVRGANVLRRCRHVFVPKARTASESVALSIADRYLASDAQVYELVFPMTTDKDELSSRWSDSARRVADVLRLGEDACFLTLGDPVLYSTYTYLVRGLRELLPEVDLVTVPGITAFSAAAALAEFPVGEGKEPVTIVPVADDLADVRRALLSGGTVVLMKVGRRLADVLDVLEETGAIERSVFVSRAGMADQRVETDPRSLRGEGPEVGYLSIILARTGRPSR